MFKKGDRVRCLVYVPGYFTKGKIYTVCEERDDLTVVVENTDTGYRGSWESRFFELVNEQKEEQVKFKFGDKVRDITARLDSPWSKEMIVLCAFDNRARCYTEDLECTDFPNHHLVLVTENQANNQSELEQLVVKANAGVEAIKILASKYKDKCTYTTGPGKGKECEGYYSLYSYPIEIIKEQPKPIFPNLTVGGAWICSVNDQNILTIGCKEYYLPDFYKQLKALVNNVDNPPNSKFHLSANRRGISDDGHTISWDEADKLLKVLDCYLAEVEKYNK